MQERQFRRQIRTRAGKGLPEVSLRWASDYFVHHKRMERTDVVECVELATAHALVWRYSPVMASPDLPLTPALLMASEDLTEAIRPLVEKARQRLFERSTPSFTTLENAVAWIEGEADRQPAEPPEDDLRRGVALRRELETRLGECARLLQRELVVAEDRRTLTYPKPSAQDGIRSVGVVPGSPLHLLEVASRTLGEYTGIPAFAIVAHILTGQRLVLPPTMIRFTVRFPPPGLPGAPRRHEVTLVLNDRDLTFQELRGVYREVRTALGLVRAKPVSERDRVLRGLVQELGGLPPQKAQKAFWERARVEWNRRHPDWSVTTWRALEMRYRRLEANREARKPRPFRGSPSL